METNFYITNFNFDVLLDLLFLLNRSNLDCGDIDLDLDDPNDSDPIDDNRVLDREDSDDDEELSES